MKRKIISFSLIVLIAIITYQIWFIFINYKFASVDGQKVFKSALISPSKIDKFILDNNIKTIINFLEPTLSDKLNPGTINDIKAENIAILAVNKKYNLNVSHINIPSAQVPRAKQLKKFFKVLDNRDNYPVLIHCYHGTGRTELYSAIYNIEYKNMTINEARAKTRLVVQIPFYQSSFGDTKEKGIFLLNYKKRSLGANSTLESIR
jgi:protein tyrosine phosphatase (PTP) superfamily phosphohydrolase (DUF442 family)